MSFSSLLCAGALTSSYHKKSKENDSTTPNICSATIVLLPLRHKCKCRAALGMQTHTHTHMHGDTGSTQKCGTSRTATAGLALCLCLHQRHSSTVLTVGHWHFWKKSEPSTQSLWMKVYLKCEREVTYPYDLWTSIMWRSITKNRELIKQFSQIPFIQIKVALGSCALRVLIYEKSHNECAKTENTCSFNHRVVDWIAKLRWTIPHKSTFLLVAGGLKLFKLLMNKVINCFKRSTLGHWVSFPNALHTGIDTVSH